MILEFWQGEVRIVTDRSEHIERAERIRNGFFSQMFSRGPDAEQAKLLDAAKREVEELCKRPDAPVQVAMDMGKPGGDESKAVVMRGRQVVSITPVNRNERLVFTGQDANGNMHFRAIPKEYDVDGWEARGAMNIDGCSEERVDVPPVPLKVPAKSHSINAGFWMRRAINAAAAPRGLKHVFEHDEELEG